MRRSRNKIHFSLQKIGLILLLLGLLFLLLAVFCLKNLYEPKNSLSFSQAPRPENIVEESDLPAKVIIPKVRIDLPVFPAKASEDVWEISEEGVSYLLGSGLPGRKGNLVIYGHNKNRLFGPIRWLEKDDEIKVINRRGEEFTYKIKETKIVTPAMIDVLYPTEDPTLTLYTCTGFLDRERFLVVAKLKLE